MPKTYRNYSMDVLGYVAPPTPINARYIAVMKIDKWVRQGQSAKRVMLNWNGGEGANTCKKGISNGVPYDSCTYVQNGLIAYKN